MTRGAAALAELRWAELRPANFRLPVTWYCSASRWGRTRKCRRRCGRKTSLGGTAACCWCLALTIITSLQLFACVGICHCAFYLVPIPEAAEVKKTALPKALREA